MSVPNSQQGPPQQVADPSGGQAHALMVPVTFENCHQAIRIRMAAGLNLPPRFVSEMEQQTGYNVPCLLGHSLALGPPLVSDCGYALPPPHLVSDNSVQPVENNAAVAQSAESIPQPIFTHTGQPIAVRLPLPIENHHQLVPYRPPNLGNENRAAALLRRPANDEGSPEIDSRLPPRFVRLEGTNFSGLRGNLYRPRREGTKDFKSGSPDS